jgi:hypothetical protein
LSQAYFFRTSGSERYLQMRGVATDELEFATERASGWATGYTTDFNATTNTWYFIAAVYNEDGTVWGGTDNIEFATGGLRAKMTQRAKTIISTGTGATEQLSNAGVFITNRDNNDSRRLNGHMAFFAYVPSELSLDQIESIRRKPLAVLRYTPEFLLFPGMQGTTVIKDFGSAGVDWDINNMTLGDDLPIPIFAKSISLAPYVVAAVPVVPDKTLPPTAQLVGSGGMIGGINL